jgi:hypothetical protein
MENWKDVVGYEGLYQVSDLGRVRALAKVDASGHKRKAKPIKMSPNSDGYPTFAACRDGKQKAFTVHSEVLKAFVGPRPEGFDACHKDDVKTNNKLTNLKWASKSENHGGDRNRNGNYSSDYNGVGWHKARSKWAARVGVGGKMEHIGLFDTEIEAAKAFDKYCDLHKLDKHMNGV